MAGLRKKSNSWYKDSLTKFTTYICVKSSSDAELERCVDSSSSDAVRDINGKCVVMLDTDSCNSKGKCERRSNCKWDDVVPSGTDARRQLFTDADVTTATKWMSTGYPSSLAPFVAPGTVMGVLTALGCIGFVVARCMFNQCGGREPSEKGYSRCDIIIPTLTFLVCSLAVFICMVITAALNTNISDGVEGVLYSLKATLENANIFVANLLVPLNNATTELALATKAVNSQLKNSDWIATDGATLRQMLAEFGSIYYNHGAFPSLTCDPTSSDTFCMACPDRVCGSPVTFFVNNSDAAISASSDIVGDAVGLLLSSLVTGSTALDTALRTAARDIAVLGVTTNSSMDVVDVLSSTFNNLSFSRSALVVCVFFFGMIASILGIIAIVKNACTAKTTQWVHLLHVSWALGVLVAVLSFVLSASLLAVGAVWYDSCEYMKVLHQDMSPYASTQMSAMANACFNGSNILTPLGLDTPLSFSCNVEEEYAVVKATDTTSVPTIIATYGQIVSNYDLTDFSFNSTRSRSLVSKLATAATKANITATTKFTTENVLTPWLAYNLPSTKYNSRCANSTADVLPVCFMNAHCDSKEAGSQPQAACQVAFSDAYQYMLAFDKASTMLDEMREALLGDTGKNFPEQWNYSVSISEFATSYFSKITALKTGPISTMLGDKGVVRNLLTSVEQARCSGDCSWTNLSFDAINEALCNDVLGTTLAISLCALFLSLFLLPLIVSAIILQKRLRGVAKGTYDQLEARLQELERRAKQQKQETEGLAPGGEGAKSAGGLGALGGLFKGKKVQSPSI
ncbi:putative protoporphyrinogen oxidase [Phytophthora cinnamomi]|uniref:putative protoporphyrinogen oxidase n=1 Tax=Phytophthora cinnamomi TaxID=4785 RepID=UPI00355ACA8A|nr:putative protoporphyrinogen oxidase [Phytophthora cinnamomi]